MSFFKTTQLLSLKIRPKTLSRASNKFRYFSLDKTRKTTNYRGYLLCTLFFGSALGYKFLQSEHKLPTVDECLNFFIPSVSALDLKDDDNRKNRNKYNFIADVVDICAPAVVLVQVKESVTSAYHRKSLVLNSGSGFIVKEDGLILTNCHVVMGAIRRTNVTVTVRLVDGSIHDAVVENINMETDLATIRIKKKNLPIIKLGNSKDIRPGEFVVAIGAPLTLSNSITSGIVSSPNRRGEELGISHKQMSYIQTDAAITFGNSGGPLVNLEGEVIGINAMKVSPGISFAIPVDYAKEFLEKSEAKRRRMTTSQEFKNSELGRKRYLGITMITLVPEMISDMQHIIGSSAQFVKHGVLIWRIAPGSPADVFGLKNGDIITDVNGKPVVSAADIYQALDRSDSLVLDVVRNGQVWHFKIEPEILQ